MSVRQLDLWPWFQDQTWAPQQQAGAGWDTSHGQQQHAQQAAAGGGWDADNHAAPQQQVIISAATSSQRLVYTLDFVKGCTQLCLHGRQATTGGGWDASTRNSTGATVTGNDQLFSGP